MLFKYTKFKKNNCIQLILYCIQYACHCLVFVCVVVYLEAASFGRVQNEELFQQVLTVGGHVEWNPVFTTQHTFSQFLETYKCT